MLQNCSNAASLPHYDGTLVPIAARPEEARPTPAVLDLLTRLASAPGIRLTIVSGRPVAELSTLFACAGTDLNWHAWIGDSHPQWQRESDAPSWIVHASDSTPATRSTAIDSRPGWIHSRRQTAGPGPPLPVSRPSGGSANSIKDTGPAQALSAQRCRADLLHGKKVVEIRPVGVNKGKAVAALLQQTGRSVFPIYVGDDTTDEDAFQVLADRGLSILVSNVARPTRAHYYVEDPQKVCELLEHVLTCLVHTSEKNSPAR